MLKDFASKNGTKVSAIDHMDDGSPIKLTIEINPNTGDALFGAFSEPFVGKLLDVFSTGRVQHSSHFAVSDFHKAFLVH